MSKAPATFRLIKWARCTLTAHGFDRVSEVQARVLRHVILSGEPLRCLVRGQLADRLPGFIFDARV
jgi:hypothetical protein